MTAKLRQKKAIKLRKQKNLKSIKRPESIIKTITNSTACRILAYELSGRHRQKLKIINSGRHIYFPKLTQRKRNTTFSLTPNGTGWIEVPNLFIAFVCSNNFLFTYSCEITNIQNIPSRSASSEEDNSPTELNNCRRLIDKPPLVCTMYHILGLFF